MSATFDSRNMYTAGVLDANTGFEYDATIFLKMRTRTIVGALSRASNKVYSKYPGSGPSIEGQGIIVRRNITKGDMVRYNMQDHISGTPTYGDSIPQRGNFLTWKNADARVNRITSPAIPVQGEMDQKRVMHSIKNIPMAVRGEVVDYMAEEYERQFLINFLYGASPSVLLPRTEGGLGHNLGVGAGAGAGVPLMQKNFWTPDTGYVTYDSTAATYNSAVNDAIAGIDPDADDMLSLVLLEQIISGYDDIKLWAPTINGKQYKACHLMDTDLYYRLNNLLRPLQKDAMPRGKDNPIFNYGNVIEFMDCLFIAVPNLKKFRMAYNGTNGYPDIGPGLRSDHRNYTTTSKKAIMLALGAKATLEGYDGSVKVTPDIGRFNRGLEYIAESQFGFVRGEFYAEDGTTGADACVNQSSACQVFYEPGVGVNYN